MNRFYPHLFEPIRIGRLLLKSRLIASPNSQNDINPDGTLHERNIAYFARKAQGGAASVTVGDGIVERRRGMSHPIQLLLDSDVCLPSLVRCAEAIHRFGSIASVELSHGGACCDPAFIGGQRPIGPSEVPVKIGFQTEGEVETRSEAMTPLMMADLAERYAEAAARAKRAGFDMCCIHGGHGWLLGQFLSPNMNLRTDEYGGSIENRCRFPVMVAEAIRRAAGPDFPIEYRLNGDDFFPGGLTINDAVAACKILEPHVDAFHVSAGVHYSRSSTLITHSLLFEPRGHLVHLAAAVKAAVKLPVITVGGHAEPAEMERIIASGRADVIALARQTLADPDTIHKARLGREAEIRRCLRCGYCQATRFMTGTARCSVNPEIGQEDALRFLRPSARSKRVFVAGGGPAGMQAALTAARLGHKVTLYEKSDSLGGALRFAKNVPFKSDLFKLTESMAAELSHCRVDVRLLTEVTPALAQSVAPDVLIAAFGAKPIVPPIAGTDKPFVRLASQTEQTGEVGDRVVVIGGGLVGCETAVHLAQRPNRQNEVTIVEMLDKPAGDGNFRYRWVLEEQLERSGVTLLLRTRCVAITDAGVTVQSEAGEERTIPADTAVIAAGVRSLQDEAEALRECAPIYIPIGDCVKPGQVTQAIRSGHDAALSVDAAMLSF
ncbi:MAG: FAD-dependent oxidoreductase [Clostridiales Family XIII bacterium]|jgi:2,4-dienoyl-CoA reductase-like NADH-dependent reductase (Old Yellow Enzyme family)/thioredoxin reductase|nr:FAD-dependent oxidoreductase [Clostridiales Family XIII bacterium]